MDKFHSSGLSIFASAGFLLCLPLSLLAQSGPDSADSAAGSSGVASTEGKIKDKGSQEISATRAPTGSATTRKVVAAALPLGMIKVPAGTIRLGISAKELEEIVTKYGKTKIQKGIYRKRLLRELGNEKRPVQPFYLGKHEVTNRQYYIFIKATWPAHRFPFNWWKQSDIDKKRDAAHAKWESRKKAGERVPPFEFDTIEYWDTNWAKLEWDLPEKDADKPVGYVTYDEARAFCTWAGVRLPTQAEWQLGFDGERYTWGKDWKPKVPVDRNVVPAGSGSFGPNKLGFTEMMGNVWEWVDERFDALKGYDQAYIDARKIWNRKKIDTRGFPTPLFGDQRIILGGCAQNWGQAPVAYRRQNRYPLSEDNRAEAVGFRLAKSITPAFDATTLRYRYDYDKDLLLGHQLDVPSVKDRKAMRRTGIRKEFRIRGGERWDLVDGLIHGYHMISVVPVKEVKPFGEIRPKNEKVWKEWSAKHGTTGKHGLPLATIFTTEKIWFATKDVKGTKGKLQLAPDMYTVYYRGKGLPDELKYAMLAGGMELRSNKGKRKDEEQKKREAEAKKKAEEKAQAKKGNIAKKKKKKKSKKRKGKKKGRGSNSSVQVQMVKKAMATWKEVVDGYGIDDKITKDYPKKKRPQMIRIQPGSLMIPVDRDILLIRDHKGDYVGWTPVRRALTLKGKGETKFKADPTAGTIDYAGFLKFDARKVLPFEFAFHMSAEEMAKSWTFEQ